MARKTLDDKIAELQAKKAHAERLQAIKTGLQVALAMVREKRYEEAASIARNAAADLDALNKREEPSAT